MTLPSDLNINAWFALPNLEAALLQRAGELIASDERDQELLAFVRFLWTLAPTPRGWAVRKAVNYLLSKPELEMLFSDLTKAQRDADEAGEFTIQSFARDLSFQHVPRAALAEVFHAFAILTVHNHGLVEGEVLCTDQSPLASMTVVATFGRRAVALLHGERSLYGAGEIVYDNVEGVRSAQSGSANYPHEVWIGANDSPVAGQSGFAVDNRFIAARLKQEQRAGRLDLINPGAGQGMVGVRAREETMLEDFLTALRADGAEFVVSNIESATNAASKARQAPRERLAITALQSELNAVLRLVQDHRGDVADHQIFGDDIVLAVEAYSRDLLGFAAAVKKASLSAFVLGRAPPRWSALAAANAAPTATRGGALVSKRASFMTDAACRKLAARHKLFIRASEPVYAGMVIGECAGNEDVVVDLSNAHLRFGDANEVALETTVAIRKFSLGEAWLWLRRGEALEVTPADLRIWKRRFDVDEGEKSARISA